MTQRVDQKQPGVRMPEKMLVCIDPTCGVSWVKQCKDYARSAIKQDFIDDPALFKKPKILPKKRSLWRRFWRRRRPDKKLASITQKLTLVLEARTRRLSRVDVNAPTEGMVINKYWCCVDNARVDENATEPMSLEEIMR